jgi:hypothetical protein
MRYIKDQVLHRRNIGDQQLVIKSDGDVDIKPASGIVNITGNLRVTGNIAGSEENQLTYYVSLEGDDNNSGLGPTPDRAKRTIKAAVAAAPAGSTIQLAPGNYYENNPITLKERQTVRGTSLRNTQIWPLNNQTDIFYVDNACYIYQVTFRGLRDPGWCVKIKPGALVTVSPYVQNCTNMNGPWLNDGTEFVPFQTVQIEGVEPTARPIIDDERVPLAKRVNETGGGNGMLVDGNEYDQRSLVFSMVADAFTQIAQGGIGFHITNFGYTQIVSCFTVFCRTGFLTTNGGYLSISNSVSDFGTYGLIADGVFDTPYTSARPVQDYTSSVGSISVINQGSGYTSAPSVVIDPPLGSGGVQATAVATIDLSTGKVTSISITENGSGYTEIPGVALVGGGYAVIATAEANITTNQIITINSFRDRPQVGSVIVFDGDPTKYYITNTNITTQPLIYEEEVCRRDVAYIVDAVLGDMVLGTNYQSVAAGRSYLRSAAAKVLREQLAPTIYGIEAARDAVLERIPDSNPANEVARYEIIERFAAIINIIEEGDSSVAPDIVYDNLSLSAETVNSKNNILANKEFIVEETTKYIAEQFTNLSYNQEKCERDVKLILSAVSYDVALGTNYNAVVSGLAYIRGNAAYVQSNQKIQTISAIDYAKTQVAGLSSVSSDATALARSNAAFDEIIDLLNAGDSSSAADLQYPSPTNVTLTRLGSKNHLRANREFIRAEIIAWIDDNYPELTYDVIKCERDVGYIVDALSYDILYKGNSATLTVANSYFVDGVSQLGLGETEATIAAYERLQFIINQIVLGNSITKSPLNALSQDFSSGNATGTEVDLLTDLTQIIIDVITDNSLDDLPEIEYPDTSWVAAGIETAKRQIFANRDTVATQVTEYILLTYPDFTYSVAKCKRDVGFIIDAVARDVRLETNHNSITAGLAYKRSYANVVTADQYPATIAAIREAKRLASNTVEANTTVQTEVNNRFDVILDIIEEDQLPSEGTVFTSPPVASFAEIDSARQLQDNRPFLIEEFIAYTDNNHGGFVYNETTWRNNAGYIIDAITHDLLYGGNLATLVATRAYFDEGATTIEGEELEYLDALSRLRAVIPDVIQGNIIVPYSSAEPQILTPNFGTSTESTTATDLLDILITALSDSTGLETTPENESPNFTWQTSSVSNSVDLLVDASPTIQQGVIDYITNTILGFTYNVEKCERDTVYIIEAALYDMMYGGNKQTRRAAQAYYSNAVIVGQEVFTELTYKHLATIMQQIAKNTAITPSEGVTLTQTIGSGAGTTSADNLYILVEKIAQVIKGAALPDEINHNYSLGDSDLNSKRTSILGDLGNVVDDAIFTLNAEYGGVASITLFPGVVSVLENTYSEMINVSTVSTSGHSFEYVGAGITYNALPFFGGTPDADNEFIETNGGKVFSTSTDQIGNFRVGNFFTVNALTGAIDLQANEINLSGIAAIGPFRRNGIPVGVELKEVNDNTDLTSSLGVPDGNTVPTQTAVVSYVENRYLNKLTGGTVDGPVEINDDTVSINVTTGALVVGGGVGIADDVNIGGTLDVTGAVTFTEELTVPSGGTGNTTFTLNGVLYGNNGNAIQVTAAGTAGQVLKVDVNGIPFFGDPDGGPY